MATYSDDAPSTSGSPADEEGRFERLYRHNYSPIVAFFVRRGFSTEDSRELAQDVFFRAYRGIAAFRGEASERTWLFRIAQNVWSNAVRYRHAKGRNAPVALFDEVQPVDEAPTGDDHGEATEAGSRSGALDVIWAGPELDEDLLARERAKLLREAINQLPPRMRRCVGLRIYQELKYHEIAALLLISEETVKALLFQARSRLRAELDDSFSDIEFS